MTSYEICKSGWYHRGGKLHGDPGGGIRPDEVPAILRVEEIKLTPTMRKVPADVIERRFPEIQHDQAMQDRVAADIQDYIDREMAKVFGK